MDDTIYRQDTIGAIIKRLGIKDESFLTEQEKTIVQVLRGMSSAQRWTPCSERLPDKYIDEDGVLVHYLVCDSDGDIGTGYYEPDSDEHWKVQWPACNDADLGVRIVAWMPLPKPWKGE